MEKKSQTIDDVAIVVLTCQKYSDILQHFFILLNKYWPDCNLKKYVITDDPNPTELGGNRLSYPELNWSGRLKSGLKDLYEKHIILLLDDYLLFREIDNEKIHNIISFIQKERILYYRLVNIPLEKHTESEICEINPERRYGVNFQAAIWDKDWLLSILPEEDVTAWKSEVFIAQKYRNNYNSNTKIVGRCLYDVSEPLVYLNGIIKGQWYPKSILTLKNSGYNIPQGNRKTLSNRELIYMFIVKIIRQNLPDRFRVFLKNKILHKLGFNFFSDD